MKESAMRPQRKTEGERFDQAKRELRDRMEEREEREREPDTVAVRGRVAVNVLKQISDDLQYLYRILQAKDDDLTCRTIMETFQDVKARLKAARREIG